MKNQKKLKRLVKDAYSQGFNSALRTIPLDNPYSRGDLTKYMSWQAGFNDCKAGYKLDLTVFE